MIWRISSTYMSSFTLKCLSLFTALVPEPLHCNLLFIHFHNSYLLVNNAYLSYTTSWYYIILMSICVMCYSYSFPFLKLLWARRWPSS